MNSLGIRGTVSKINRVRQPVERINAGCEVELDGGVNEETTPPAAAASASLLVAESAVFGNSSGGTSSMSKLRESIAPSNARVLIHTSN